MLKIVLNIEKKKLSSFQQVKIKKLFCLKKKPKKNFVILNYFKWKTSIQIFYKTTKTLQKYVVICNQNQKI